MLARLFLILAVFGFSVLTAAQETISLTDIQNADPEQLFVAHLRFERAVTVGAVRTVAAEYGIPRVLAFVAYGPVVREQRSGLLIVGLGNMYQSETARQHSECRALTHVNTGQPNDLRGRPIDDWTVSKINIYANAHIIRELLAGVVLPPAALIDASVAEPEHLRKLENHTRSEVTQSISTQRNTDLPAYCSQFLAPLDSPVLTGGFPPGFQYPEAVEGEEPKEYAYRLLAQLPSDNAVTIEFKLNSAANVDDLASLVRQYDIRGMSAEMVPERSNKRVIAVAELSTFGAESHRQVHRVRCQMRLGNEEPQASSEWHADWISVSLSAEYAARFLSHPNLAQVRISGSYPGTDLERLEAYYDRLQERVYEMPRSIQIPAGCDDIYVHNQQDEIGSIGPLFQRGD